MNMRPGTAMVCCALCLGTVHAQSVDPNLLREVTTVRAEVARSLTALRGYAWNELTEVLVGGNVSSSNTYLCRYDQSGKLSRTPLHTEQGNTASATSKRPFVRQKADMQDYIERAGRLILYYVPPKPEDIDDLVKSGFAAVGQSQGGKSEVRFNHYFQDGDSVVFTYGSDSKVLRQISVASFIRTPKDPVTLEAVFETLPDGVNHLSTAKLTAKKRSVVINRRNSAYQKIAN